MVIQEVISIIMKKSKLAEKNVPTNKSFTSIALKYLFDCYSRIEIEERQYTKV